MPCLATIPSPASEVPELSILNPIKGGQRKENIKLKPHLFIKHVSSTITTITTTNTTSTSISKTTTYKHISTHN